MHSLPWLPRADAACPPTVEMREVGVHQRGQKVRVPVILPEVTNE
jgi:hypothetical protein